MPKRLYILRTGALFALSLGMLPSMAWAAAQHQETLQKATMPDNFELFPRGGANTAYARYFVGNSYLNMLSTEGVIIGNVTFEPACRNSSGSPLQHQPADGRHQLPAATELGGKG